MKQIKRSNIATDEQIRAWLPDMNSFQLRESARLFRAQAATLDFTLNTPRELVKNGCREFLDCIRGLPKEYLKQSFYGSVHTTVKYRLAWLEKNAAELLDLLGNEVLVGIKAPIEQHTGKLLVGFSSQEARRIIGICCKIDFVIERVLYYSHGYAEDPLNVALIDKYAPLLERLSKT